MTIRTLVAVLLASTAAVRGDAPAAQLLEGGVAKFNAAFQAWDDKGFQTAADDFQRAATRDPRSAAARYWEGVALFHRMLRLRNPPSGKPDETTAATAADGALRAFEAALAIDPAHAESHALAATLYGMKIHGAFFGAVRYGPKVQRHLKQALAHGPENPRVVYLHGVGLLHNASDEASRRAALATLQTAEKHFAREAARPPRPLEPRWGRSSCLTFIGKAHEALGEPHEALASYRRARAMHRADRIAADAVARLSKH